MSTLSSSQVQELLHILSERFHNNMHRHNACDWNVFEAKLLANSLALLSVYNMEKTGGEPDIVSTSAHEYVIYDCSVESPLGRRSLCYDQLALDSRKENKPKHSAIGMATDMGVALLTEQEYTFLQSFGDFDLKTSSWIATPQIVRSLGGALFCDRRYNTVFTYHNGAESYYAARGFRSKIEV